MAVLDEQRGEKKEVGVVLGVVLGITERFPSLQCLKRYRIAKQIFELLRSDAKSERDIRQLQCCILTLL